MILNEEIKPLKIFIGWDSREDIAYQVARQSILDHASVPVEIIPLKQKQLRKEELYWRDVDALAATEFTYTRYLIPELTGFGGWALFIDCDFLFVEDVAKLFELVDDNYAIMCAQHEYHPPPGRKMDGKQQTQYPRKNWSSMMLINCEHPSNKVVTKEFVNDLRKTGAYLHRFSWLEDSEIGAVSHEWNWLVNWYNEPLDGKPKAIHYTEGGPWFEKYQDCEYSADWYKVSSRCYAKIVEDQAKEIKMFDKKHIELEDLTYTDQKKKLFKHIIHSIIDPTEKYYPSSKEEALKLWNNEMGNKIAAIDSEGGVNYKSKGHAYDPYLTSFIIGSGGYISSWSAEENTDTALVIRGLGGGSRKAIKHCWKTGRTFYAIDTGYLGNVKTKIWNRVSKNALQNLGPIVNRPTDRLKLLNYKFNQFTPGRKILICPPSEKVMDLWDQPSPQKWTENVIEELKQYTDRPIEVRLKPDRTDRVNNNTMQSALSNDVYCLVTYNSIAATEALLFGKPAIALGENAAQVLCNRKLKDIEKLRIPTKDEMLAFASHLSYCQFTQSEFANGTAWRIVNESR